MLQIHLLLSASSAVLSSNCIPEGQWTVLGAKDHVLEYRVSMHLFGQPCALRATTPWMIKNGVECVWNVEVHPLK